MIQIVAFAGRKQSGKTTCSEFLVNYFNRTVEPFNSAKIYNFADPLKKDICMNILGLTYDQCYGSDEHKNSLTSIRWKDIPEYNDSWITMPDYDQTGLMSARQVMQHIGTNIFRKIKNDVWSKATINKIKNEKPKLAIIADCRFPNEVDAVKNAGGCVIKLTRNPYNSNHESEIALDKIYYDQNNFDFIIDNTTISIEEQNAQVYNFLTKKGILSL